MAYRGELFNDLKLGFKGSQVMKLDVLVLEHILSERQKQALEGLMQGRKILIFKNMRRFAPA